MKSNLAFIFRYKFFLKYLVHLLLTLRFPYFFSNDFLIISISFVLASMLLLPLQLFPGKDNYRHSLDRSLRCLARHQNCPWDLLQNLFRYHFFRPIYFVTGFCWSPWTLELPFSINSKVSFLDHVNPFQHIKSYLLISLSLLKSPSLFYFFITEGRIAASLDGK
jgi:hypothetical protein